MVLKLIELVYLNLFNLNKFFFNILLKNNIKPIYLNKKK